MARARLLLGAVAGVVALLAPPSAAGVAASRAPARSIPNPTQVLVVGDSVGEAFVQGIGRAGIRVMNGTSWGCRLVRGRIRYTTQVGKFCVWRTLWHRAVRELDPGVVVLASGVWDLFDVQPRNSKQWLVPGTRAWARHYAATLTRAAEVLGARGAQVVIPTIPYFHGASAGAGTYPASSYDPARVRAANEVIRRLARETPAPFAAPDLNRLLSPTGAYQDGLGDVPSVRVDGVHFNDAGITAVGSWLAPRLRRWLGDSIRKHRQPGPVRVLLVGGSITVDYQDVTAGLLSGRGYEVSGNGVAQSSILDAGVCDGARARALLARHDPDVVVFESSGDYGLRPGIRPCGPRVEPGSDAFYRQWRTAARRNQRILTSRGAEFLWVLNPAVAVAPKRTMIPVINSMYRELAGKRHGLVDGWNALGGSRFDRELREGQRLNGAGAALMGLQIAGVVR